MFRFPLALATALAAVCSAPAFAETDPSAAADLATIRQKAEATPGALRSLDQIVRTSNQLRQTGGPDYDVSQIFRLMRINSRSQFPVNIAAIERRPTAIRRAQLVSQILMADLDNDWSVTREELTSMLELPGGSNDNLSAGLFLVGDKDENNILTLDETKAVATTKADADTSFRPNQLPLSLFDFDGDGQFTAQEYDRTLRALSQ